MKLGRLLPTLSVVGLLTVTFSGCGASPQTVSIGYAATEVVLRPGDTLEVDFGEVNFSTGEAWVVSTEPTSDVLSSGEEHAKYLGEEGMVGAPSEVTYTFTAMDKGTTTLEFEYQFRGAVPDSPQDQKFSSIDVTVE